MDLLQDWSGLTTLDTSLILMFKKNTDNQIASSSSADKAKSDITSLLSFINPLEPKRCEVGVQSISQPNPQPVNIVDKAITSIIIKYRDEFLLAFKPMIQQFITDTEDLINLQNRIIKLTNYAKKNDWPKSLDIIRMDPKSPLVNSEPYTTQMNDLIIKWKNDALNIMIANVTQSTTDKQTQRNLFIAQTPQKANEISKTVIKHFFPYIHEHDSILTNFYTNVCKELLDRMTLYSNYKTNTELEARSIEKLKILRQDHSQKQVLTSAAQIMANNQSLEGKSIVGALVNNSINNSPVIKHLKKVITKDKTEKSKQVDFSLQSNKSYASVASSSQPKDKNNDKNNNKNKKRKREQQPLQNHRQSQSQSHRHTHGHSHSQSQSQSSKNSMAQETRLNPSKPSSNKKQRTQNVTKTSVSIKR